VSNWVTDVAGTAAPQPSNPAPSQPAPSQPAPAPTAPTSPAKEFVGSSRADKLDGTSGADVLKGLGGSDTYVVNNAGDKVVELDGQGRDKILSSIDLTLPKAIEDILLTGSGNIGATGNALNNTITGQSGNNVLRGGDGNDVIDGKGGQDKLHGDGGKDKFVFSAAADSKVAAPDMIMDFLKGSDVIDIRPIDANVLLGGNQKFVFIGDQDFAGSGQLRVEYDEQTNVTHVQGSVDYDAVADFQIDLAGKVALSASDFLL
jgi:Ca2+-binding RTX toxin-like protein